METKYLATLENSSQASMVQDILMNEGIESFVKNGVISTVMNIPGLQIEIEVNEKDYVRAVEVLKNAFSYLIP